MLAATTMVVGTHAPEYPRYEISRFSTPLQGRSAGQRHNASLAAAALDRKVVQPGECFSFNGTVRVWSRERGYVEAPVSYEGILTEAVGGGVCQLSTTLYNAALLADLHVVERHRHAVAPAYVAPGRDAAVAQYSLDLRFVNDMESPIVIRAQVSADQVSVQLCGAKRRPYETVLVSRVLDCVEPRIYACHEPPVATVRLKHGRRPFRGACGWHVVTYRCRVQSGHEVYRERVSDDKYRPVDYQLEEAPQIVLGDKAGAWQ
jgi:hypothetical protein